MRTKTILLLVSFLLIISTIYGQKNSKKTLIGISYSLSTGNLTADKNKNVLNFKIKNGSSVGISVFHRLNKSFGLESGLEYSLFNIEQTTKNKTKIDTVQTQLTLLELPLLVRFPIEEHFYLNGGLLFNLDMNSTSAVSSQSGIGLMAGAGAIYNFETGISIFANPYLKVHSLLRFKSSEQKNSLIEYGLKVGVAYHF